MIKKVGILVLVMLVIFPVVLALDTQLIIKTDTPDLNATINILDPGSGISLKTLNEVTDSSGDITTLFSVSKSKVDISVLMRLFGKIVISNRSEGHSTLGLIIIDLEEPVPEPVVVVEEETTEEETTEEETTEEETTEEETTEEETTGEEATDEEATDEETTEETTEAVDAEEQDDVKEEAAVDSIEEASELDNLKSKVIYFAAISLIGFFLILFLVVAKKMLFAKEKEIPTDSKPPQVLNLPEKKSDSVLSKNDDDDALDDAQKKIKEAQEEINRIKNKKNKIKDAEKKLEADMLELKLLKGEEEQ